MPPWQVYGLFLHVRQGIAFFTALKTEIRVAEKPIIGRFMLVFWRFYALRDTEADMIDGDSYQNMFIWADSIFADSYI